MDMIERYAPKHRFNGFQLKVIACGIVLACNFAGLLFGKSETVQNAILLLGGIPFPIFAYLLVEGFFHSSDLKKYIIRLGVAAIVSEFTYDLYIFGVEGMTNAFYSQNILFTLLIGLITIAAYDKIQIKYRNQPRQQNIYGVLILLIGSMSAILMQSDYSFYGVFMILIMYLFHRNKRWMLIGIVVLIGFLGGASSLFQVLALPFIWMYNGEEGKKAQRIFYTLFPLHLLLLSAVRQFLL